MNITLNAKDQQKKWTITDTTIYYKDKEIAVSSITKVRYEPIEPPFKTGKITIYCGEEVLDPIYNLLYDKSENDFGEEVVEFILLKALKIKESKIGEEKEKIKIKKSHFMIRSTIIILLIISIGIIIYSIANFEPVHTSNKTHREKCGMCGKMVNEDDMQGKWCKDCQNDAFGDDGWYYEIQD